MYKFSFKTFDVPRRQIKALPKKWDAPLGYLLYI